MKFIKDLLLFFLAIYELKIYFMFLNSKLFKLLSLTWVSSCYEWPAHTRVSAFEVNFRDVHAKICPLLEKGHFSPSSQIKKEYLILIFGISREYITLLLYHHIFPHTTVFLNDEKVFRIRHNIFQRIDYTSISRYQQRFDALKFPSRYNRLFFKEI